MCHADDLVDDVRDALRRAESFGDISGIIVAQWAYGTVLLRAENASHDEAIDVLERAQTSIQKHNVLTLALATIGADLAIDAARNGQRDEAIDELRASFSLHMGSGCRVFVGCPGEALVELLIDRGSTDDLAEAHRIVDQWQAQRPGIPALDLWWLKSRAIWPRRKATQTATPSWPSSTSRFAKSSTPVGDSMRRAGWSSGDAMATILAYTSPALGHLLPISALLTELSRRGHTVHVRTLSTGVEIGRGSASPRTRSIRGSKR